ncbi:Uncharacterised protein [Actinobaculum suis]|uniref:site-specific DNA-methyltransferase (adenine-specific) n=1 Tax=Actinobaculum suis TaxID=1657 RepID=A0A7Z8Y7S5_9ACTO|nr:DNA methyltransferase [Actinobaculum suis]VDG75449.1 Uncharacterised protein [Actinobaculum suis]
MASFDSFANIDEWISDYYLTTSDRGETFENLVNARRREWEEYPGNPWERFSAVRSELALVLPQVEERNDAVAHVGINTGPESPVPAGDAEQPGTAQANRLLRRAFGYAESQEPLRFSAPGQLVTMQGSYRHGVLAVNLPFLDTPEALGSLVLPVREKDSPHIVYQDVFKAVGQAFLSDLEPAFAVLFAGQWVVLGERETWAQGRYLAINVALAVERQDERVKGELRHVVAALAFENTSQDAEGNCWWSQAREAAVNHSMKVSESLRGAVRDSIEIIGNDVLDRLRDQHRPAAGAAISAGAGVSAGANPADANPADANPAGATSADATSALSDSVGSATVLPDPASVDGDDLARQALRYLYRILFLLFAEASPELQILPVGDPDYQAGYSLSRLRDLILEPPASVAEEQGTHLYDSLQILFRLVNEGNNSSPASPDDSLPGLRFEALSADLFLPAATPLIDGVKLSNRALTDVLTNLLLTPETAKQDRGFISYASLGVSELGQVYEGLMSYRGLVAAEDLVEVAPNGEADKGSWLVSLDKIDDLPEESIVMSTQRSSAGELVSTRRIHRRGSFVFRQSSRDRERSASFYTPQVLTEFTVGQAIAELQAAGTITRAEDILQLDICEPALGSGAFAVEAVRQLATLYLDLRQEELGESIPADSYTRELQQVKSYIALHQVYGVDLNATAVELAEISLWLDTMTAGLQAPWFGLRLRRGNSLIGALHATYAPSQVVSGAYLHEPAKRSRLTFGSPQELAAGGSDADSGARLDTEDLVSGDSDTQRIFHFLLPSKGWGSAVEAKGLSKYAGDSIRELRTWRRSVQRKFTAKQLRRLAGLSERVEILWRFALRRIEIAEQQVHRDIPLWGRQTPTHTQAVSREQIEAELFENTSGAYGRLRLVMDAWCALWFWPLNLDETAEPKDAGTLFSVVGDPQEDREESDSGAANQNVRQQSGSRVSAPPSVDEWLDTLEAILGQADYARNIRPTQLRDYRAAGPDLVAGMDWEELASAESLAISTGGVQLSVPEIIAAHPWLQTVESIAAQQGFFHWDLDFATVFARGGFDLQVGNPPWVRPRSDEDGVLAEFDPRFAIFTRATQAKKREWREPILATPAGRRALVDSLAETAATSASLSSTPEYPHLVNQQSDLYRGFMERTWGNQAPTGIVSLIHPESHFGEVGAAALRREAYLRLRRHWQFVNELSLFDIHHLVSYGVHVYGNPLELPSFLQAVSLYHPQTVVDSLRHDGSGPAPGIKNDENKWDLRPHRDRIIQVDQNELQVWHAVMEGPETPVLDTRMVYTVNRDAANVLEKLAQQPRISRLELQSSRGWDETIDKTKGYFDRGWAVPDSWEDVILQGPHLGISLPMQKQPNETLRNNLDWTEIDIEAIPSDFIPATGYQPDPEKDSYAADYGTWKINGTQQPVRSFYRIAWRYMAANTGFRTLYPAIIPPGTAHVHGVATIGPTDSIRAAGAGAMASSLFDDFFFRVQQRANISATDFANLPLGDSPLLDDAARIYLRLNCLTSAYADLWEACTGEPWTPEVPIRNAAERRKAQIDIDAIAAINFGVTADELCSIYRTQFPVMRMRYDEVDFYDANGRLVENNIARAERSAIESGEGGTLSEEARTWVHPQSGVTYVFEYPFRVLDREADMRKAYEYWQGVATQKENKAARQEDAAAQPANLLSPKPNASIRPNEDGDR